MNNNDRQTALADAIENARDDVKFYSLVFKLSGLVFTLGTVLTLAGFPVGIYSGFAGIDMGGLAAALICSGLSIALLGGIAFAAAINTYKHDRPKAKLREAQRKYDTFLMSDA